MLWEQTIVLSALSKSNWDVNNLIKFQTDAMGQKIVSQQFGQKVSKQVFFHKINSWMLPQLKLLKFLTCIQEKVSSEQELMPMQLSGIQITSIQSHIKLIIRKLIIMFSRGCKLVVKLFIPFQMEILYGRMDSSLIKDWENMFKENLLDLFMEDIKIGPRLMIP